jgi:hypothetical protein
VKAPVVGAAVTADVEASGVLANVMVGVVVMAEVGSNPQGMEGGLPGEGRDGEGLLQAKSCLVSVS